MNYLLPQLIDAHARHPDRDAIHFLDQKLSYAQLVHQANQLANCLLAEGAIRGERVGIYMDKCLEMAVALYGVMKCGAAYVPLDPLAPAQRLAEIIDDCGIGIVISGDSKKSRLLQLSEQTDQPLLVLGVAAGGDFPFVTRSWQEIFATYPPQLPAQKIIESDLAYIIYTSGSTGTPKGIMHTHHSGLSFARWAAHEYGLGPADRISNHAPLHFDLSILDFFAAAVAGASTVIIPEEYTKMPASYSQLLEDSRVSVLYTVPFALIQLLLRGALEERNLGSLRWVIFGGEPFPIKYLRELMTRLPGAVFDNMYGPAEVNGCSHYSIAELGENDAAIPIGRIGEIAEALVVDEELKGVADGETGELLVRTPTMMQGYWNRPGLNENAFFRQPAPGGCEQLFYRTGDLVRRDADGTLWFQGRKDRQVKVRGYRIELDEIEAALVAHDDVEEAAVYPVTKDGEGTRIHGSVTLKPGADKVAEDLLAYLKTRLAAYAIPSALILRDEFPRTSSGKIDRRSLGREVCA